MKFDAVVVGSGIAGLSFALKSSKLGHKVAIITKKERSDTNTNHAQGGIASVTSCADDFDSHVRDTLIAGDGLCNEAAVRESPNIPASSATIRRSATSWTNCPTLMPWRNNAMQKKHSLLRSISAAPAEEEKPPAAAFGGDSPLFKGAWTIRPAAPHFGGVRR